MLVAPPLADRAIRSRHLNLKRLSLPTLPQLLLSRDLVSLYLGTDCIVGDRPLSLEALTAILFVITQLKSLLIHPDSKTYPERRSANLPPPANLLVLRALIEFRYVGSGEYLKDLISRIDAPLLERHSVSLSQSVGVPRPSQFISRTKRQTS